MSVPAHELLGAVAQPAPKGSSSTNVYGVLRQRLVQGGYPAGAPLREVELAGELGVSRTPVREALRRLSAEGLVHIEPNKGARVAPWIDADLRSTFRLRQRLEGHAAARSAELISEEGIARLEDLCERMESAARGTSPTRFEDIAMLNHDFHRVIIAAANDGRLVEVMAAVVQVALVRHMFERYNGEQLQRSFAHHRELVAALRQRDPEWAEAVMSAHIFHARAVLFPNDGERHAGTD